MKKFIALVLVLTMALSLAACGGSGSSSKKDGEDTTLWKDWPVIGKVLRFRSIRRQRNSNPTQLLSPRERELQMRLISCLRNSRTAF